MKPAVKFVPSVFPRAVVRASVLGDVMKNHGVPDDTIQIAQTGLMSGDLTGVTFYGFTPSGILRERSTLMFDKLEDNDNMTMNVSNGRSMVEALSLKLAHAVSASVGLMQKQRLSIQYSFHIADHVNVAEACRKYNLALADRQDDATPMRLLFQVTPGRDRGLTYAHYTAR